MNAKDLAKRIGAINHEVGQVVTTPHGKVSLDGWIKPNDAPRGDWTHNGVSPEIGFSAQTSEQTRAWADALRAYAAGLDELAALADRLTA